MAKNNYTKEEMKEIIDKAEKLRKNQEETYSQEDIEKIARNLNIPKRIIKEALKIYEKSSTKSIKKSSSPKMRRFKKTLIYIIYTGFWTVFISILIIIPGLEENPWSTWVWLIPSIGLVGLIMGAFINELEGAIIGMVAGGLAGLLVIYLSGYLWGKIVIGMVLGFVAFIVFLFRFKGQIDSIIK
jgi:hypothetical protein